MTHKKNNQAAANTQLFCKVESMPRLLRYVTLLGIVSLLTACGAAPSTSVWEEAHSPAGVSRIAAAEFIGP